MVRYLFMWFISKLAVAEKEAEKEFRETRAKLWEHHGLEIVPMNNIDFFAQAQLCVYSLS